MAPFTGERGLPLRGPEVSDAILELLAVTRWGRADLLLIDMPPGIGEEILDLARLVPRLQALVVSTPSQVSVSVVERLLSVLKEIRVAVPGLIANMVDGDAGPVRSLARRHSVPLAGRGPPGAGDRACCRQPGEAPGQRRGSGTSSRHVLPRLHGREKVSIFEIIMLVCFGAAWPVSIYKSWKTRQIAGKSLPFLLIILVGYAAGILHKLLFHFDLVIYLYALNAVMVSIDAGLYIRNRIVHVRQSLMAAEPEGGRQGGQT